MFQTWDDGEDCQSTERGRSRQQRSKEKERKGKMARQEESKPANELRAMASLRYYGGARRWEGEKEPWMTLVSLCLPHRSATASVLSTQTERKAAVSHSLFVSLYTIQKGDTPPESPPAGSLDRLPSHAPISLRVALSLFHH